MKGEIGAVNERHWARKARELLRRGLARATRILSEHRLAAKRRVRIYDS